MTYKAFFIFFVLSFHLSQTLASHPGCGGTSNPCHISSTKVFQSSTHSAGPPAPSGTGHARGSSASASSSSSSARAAPATQSKLTAFTKSIDKVFSKYVKPFCFEGETLIKIRLDDGSIGNKPIRNLDPSDQVLVGFDDDQEPLFKSFIGPSNRLVDDIFEVEIGDIILRVTREHPFKVGPDLWKAIETLKENDLVTDLHGNQLPIKKITLLHEPTEVFNIQIDNVPGEDTHESYFVSELGIHVHNCRLVADGALIPAGASIIMGSKIGFLYVAAWGGVIAYTLGDANNLSAIAEDAAFITAISLFVPPTVKAATNAVKALWFAKQPKVTRDAISKLVVESDTVWRYIKATNLTYANSPLPISFELTVSNGKFWIADSATKHVHEIAVHTSRKFTPDFVRLTTQVKLSSLRAAVDTASRQGIRYGGNPPMIVNGWELCFSPPERAGQLPILFHARYLR